MKPEKWVDSVDENGVPTSQAIDIQMILKWGGDLTPLGREQSEGEGAYFRHHMYPDSEGGGVLRLHSTYRHDLKIKASDEGRVMKTAAAFTKGLLELEGPLTPILVSLVTVEEKNRQMLDKGGNCEIKEDMERCKKHIEDVLQRDVDVTDEFIDTFFPNCQTSIRTALHKLGNPRKALDRIHELIGSLCKQVEVLCQKTGEMEWHSNTDASEVSSESDYDQDADFKTLCLNETYSLMLDRWSKQNKDFKNKKTGMYDLTKVPDVYDMVRYDLIHNSHIGLKGIEELLQLAMAFADSVVPQEYGISKEDKISIGSKMCGALVEKMRDDLELVMMKTPNSDMSYALDHSHADDLDINSLSRNVRTRLYFTSESHLHTLLNVLRYPGPGIPSPISAEGLALLDETPELSYLTQIIIKLFEIENESGESSFRCEISFSPGAVNDCIIDKSSTLAPYVTLTNSIPAPEMINVLKAVIGQSAGGDSKVDSTVSVSTPNTSVPTTPSSKFSKKTSTETVVFSSNSFETSDTWEEPVSPVTVIPKKDRKLKKRINVITDTIAEESSPAEKRDGSGDAST